MASIESLHLVALGESILQRVLVTLDDCCHLAILVFVEIVEYHLEMVRGLQLLDCEGLCAYPRGRITKSNFSENKRCLERFLVIHQCHTSAHIVRVELVCHEPSEVVI